MNTDGNVLNLLGLARTAALGGNQQEALNYFNGVLEIDPTMSDAWIGKGKAAAWQSTMANIRLGEGIIAFGHAIATSPDETKTAVTNEVVGEINSVVVALYGIARDHLNEYAALDNTWVSYLGQISQLIDALNQAKLWSPVNRTTLDNIVHLCKDNIEGYTFRDRFNNNMPGAYSISESYEAVLRQNLNDAVDAIRSLDPAYAPPEIEKKTADACFVVTATMGDFNHPDVILLRQFRDVWIRKQSWGTAFIETYYRVGPTLASFIERSKPLKAVSYQVIVRPAVWLARRRMK